jgi:hypothetical protein
LAREDVLEPRPWRLLLRAASTLSAIRKTDRYDLVTSLVEGEGERRIYVRTQNIDRLDFFVNGRPTSKSVVRESSDPIASPPLARGDRVELEIRGYVRPNTLVARYVQVFPFLE